MSRQFLLAIQRVLIRPILHVPLTPLVFEQCLESILGLTFPSNDLMRMYVIAARDLVDCLATS